MASQQLTLQIFTPAGGLVLDQPSDFVRLPGEVGDIGVYPHHTASLLRCKEGALEVRSKAGSQFFYITSAMAKIDESHVVIITDRLESADGIDKNRAVLARERAEKRLDEAPSDQSIDVARAKASLQRATTRLSILENQHS